MSSPEHPTERFTRLLDACDRLDVTPRELARMVVERALDPNPEERVRKWNAALREFFDLDHDGAGD